MITEFKEAISISLKAYNLGVYTPKEVNEYSEDEDTWDEGDYLIICQSFESEDEDHLFPGFTFRKEEEFFAAIAIVPPGPVFRSTSIMDCLNEVIQYYKKLRNDTH